MTFRNLTPHQIRVLDLEHELLLELPPSPGKAARLDLNLRPVEKLGNGITVFETQPGGGVQDLPAPEPGVGLVVSAMVREVLPYRNDLFSPGELVRDENGQPKGCLGLIRNQEHRSFMPLVAIGAGIWLILFVVGKLIEVMAGK